jgi:hypothetical protein
MAKVVASCMTATSLLLKADSYTSLRPHKLTSYTTAFLHRGKQKISIINVELFCPISYESNHTTLKQQFLKLAWQDVRPKQFIAYLDGEKKRR